MKKIILAGLIIAVTITSAVPALATNLSDAQKNKKSIDSQINKVKNEKKEAEQLRKKLEEDKKALESAQAQESKLYNELLADYKKIEEEIKQIDNSIAESEKNLEEQETLFKTRVRVMYKNSNTSYFEGLLESKNLTEFIEKLKYITLISKKDKELVEDLKVAKADVEYKKQLKEESKKQTSEQISAKQEKLNNLKLSSRSVSDRVKETTAKLQRLEKMEDELIKESNELAKKIKELSTRKTYVGGTMVWPLPSTHYVGSEFGMRNHPILKKKKMHTGIDIGGKSGSSIVAANKGTVIMSGYTSGYGNRVVIDHGDGITTLYAHCSKLLVKVGQEVKAGQTIAKVGSTGLSTGPHLHFEVRVKGNPVDPLKGYLKK